MSEDEAAARLVREKTMNTRPLKLIELLRPGNVAAIEVNPRRQEVTRIIRQPEMVEFERQDRRKKLSLRRRG